MYVLGNRTISINNTKPQNKAITNSKTVTNYNKMNTNKTIIIFRNKKIH